MPRLTRLVRLAGVALVAAAVLRELRTPREERQWHGRVAGVVPYDFRPPTPARLRERWWNPDDERLFTEHVFGVGWSVNLARLASLLRRPSAEREARAPGPAPDGSEERP